MPLQLLYEMLGNDMKLPREICDLYAVAQENFKDAKRRVKNGTLAMIITEAKARNGLPEETFMNRSTIVNRVSKNGARTWKAG